MAANVLNYTEQGGDVTRIGGKLIIEPGGKLLLGDAELKQAETVAEAAGSAPTAAEFKALLDALKTAGLMATT